MRILVTGGTGYIGAHFCRLSAQRGDFVAIADDLASGVRDRIGALPLDVLDLATDVAAGRLAATLREHDIDTVVHFAARKQVGESVGRPAWYYRQNVGGLANLLLAMESAEVNRFIFSSSAAVYASSDEPVSEDHPAVPVSPYGETKLVGEWLTASAAAARPMTAVSLRYFNVAGAHAPELGDNSVTNLIPIVLDRLGKAEAPVIFGADYPTRDGTCIRDYIHVQDVAEAHLAALDHLESMPPGHRVFNVGTGKGSSVLEIVTAVMAAAGVDYEPTVSDRRAGDPAMVVAAVDRIRNELGWTARFGLDDIVRSAWEAKKFESARR